MPEKRQLSEFERRVRATCPERIASIQAKMRNAHSASYGQDPRNESGRALLVAIEHLHIDPRHFLNVNALYRDLILEELDQEAT